MSKFIVTVSSTIDSEGDKNTIEMTTVCKYSKVNSKWVLMYNEVIDDKGTEVKTLVRAADNEVSITRNGDTNSQLVMRLHEHNSCHYGTEYGSIVLGVYCSDIKNSLNENGGEVSMTYTLDVNAAKLSTNEVKIKVREVKTNVKNSL